MAWGLNIVVADLADIKNQVMEVCHNIGNRMIPAAVSLSDLERTDMGSWKAQYLLEECFDCFERLYAHAEPIFPAVRVPRLWRLSAATALVLHCWNKAHNDLDKYQLSGSHDVRVQLDQPGRDPKEARAELQRPSWQDRWNFDCMSQVFACSGLKTGTMSAIARALGFNQADRERLVNLRCSPIPLFASLVADPRALLSMMHECDVILTDSHAVRYFWPAVNVSTSDWIFRTHPHVLYWLKFAAYLSSIGVEWDLPDRSGEQTDEEEDTFSDTDRFQYCPSSGGEIHGILRCKGQTHRVRLIAHSEYPKQESSIQDLITKHSSIAQCFISGFGAACMYAQPTTSGLSFAWGVQGWEDDAKWEDVQAEVDEYKDMKIEYVSSDSHSTIVPGQPPRPSKRSLRDGRALCIPFHRFVSEGRRCQAKLDFDLLRSITWLEKCHELGFVRYEEGSFWDPDLEDMWAERAILKDGNSIAVPLFTVLLERLECPYCRTFERAFCRIHVLSKAESNLAELLFFCLENIERRRVSWSFLRLPFNWRDCWEYLYI